VVDDGVERRRADALREPLRFDAPFAEREIISQHLRTDLCEAGEWLGLGAGSRRKDAVLDQEDSDFVALLDQPGGQLVDARDIVRVERIARLNQQIARHEWLLSMKGTSDPRECTTMHS
jgi:anti-sigma factor ChrR (cupin superfamily)